MGFTLILGRIWQRNRWQSHIVMRYIPMYLYYIHDVTQLRDDLPVVSATGSSQRLLSFQRCYYRWSSTAVHVGRFLFQNLIQTKTVRRNNSITISPLYTSVHHLLHRPVVQKGYLVLPALPMFLLHPACTWIRIHRPVGSFHAVWCWTAPWVWGCWAPRGVPNETSLLQPKSRKLRSNGQSEYVDSY